MYAGCAGPLYAFALFLPTIINQVSATVTDSESILKPIYRLDTVQLAPTCSLSPSTSSLVL